MNPSSQEIVTSYRSLFRHALHAVQYSSPARFTIRDILGTTFRAGNPADFEPQKIKNTLQFLSCASKERGLEHKILKSLLITWWWENKSRPTKDIPVSVVAMRQKQSQSMLNHFEITLKMLNETMGMCLPTVFSIQTETRHASYHKKTYQGRNTL